MVTTTPQAPEQETTASAPTNGVLAMNAIRFRIPADQVAKAVAALPDRERQAIKWFAAHCRAHNLGREEVGKLLKKADGSYYSYDSAYQVLTGRRTDAGLSVEPFVKSIEAFRRITEERLAQAESGFIETRLSRMIWGVCRKSLLRKKISFIFGDSQIGKTTALREYARRNNHGETIYCDMPTGGSLGPFMAALAVSLGIPPQAKHADLRRRILDSVDDRMLVILDNVHRCLPRCRAAGARGLLTFELIQELYDAAGCGVVLSMTNEGRDQLRKGSFAKRLEQIWFRRLSPLQLPKFPPRDDMALFARAYGLEPATDEPVTIRSTYHDSDGRERTREHTDNPLRLQDHVLRTEGLGVWIAILQDASDMARLGRRSISWGAVLRAHQQSQAEAEEIQ